jgi:hypothetical protein
MVSRKLSSSVPEGGSDGWQLEYESALQETDRKTLVKRVEIAEAAILTRREALPHSPDGCVERATNQDRSGYAEQTEEGSLEVLLTRECLSQANTFASPL